MPAAKTLYVSRPLLNADDVVAWAKTQGFGKTLTADDMHVTVAFSRDAVDWDGVAPDAAPVTVIGGQRAVKPLGDKGAVVLRFESDTLADRWQELREAGASWDWPGYQPHVTISYAASGVDVDGIEPYAGALVFGPERFAEVDEDWTDKVAEKLRKAQLRDDERFTPADQLPPGLYERAKALAAKARVVEGHTVPWVAGRSLDGAEFYPDVELPEEVDAGAVKIRTRDSVLIHEMAELIRMDEGEAYDKDSNPPGTAHYDANGCEKIYAEEQGGTWQPYCLSFRPIIKDVDDEALTNLPPADKWDRRPYEDDDPVLLAQIDAAEKSTFAAPASATSGLQNYNLEGARSRRKKRRKKPAASTTTTAGDPAMKESPMDQLKLFIPIAKVDAAQRIVYGTAVDETPDRTKEVFDYATSKPLFQAWSSEFEKLTDGKSLGNVRSMHGAVAAGKLNQIGFDDARKAIDVAAKIVDDGEWQKVEEGVYTGFSIGGKYAKKWKDGDHTRYTAEPSEVSIVDYPCVPSATFSMIKADGSTELRKFKAVEPVEKIETPADNEVGEQVWINDRLPGKTFKKKAELRQALVDLDAEEAAKKTAAPVLDALAGISQSLAKRDGGDGEVITDAHIETVKKFMAANAGHELSARGRSIFEKGDPRQKPELRKELREIIAAMEAVNAKLTKKDYSAQERKQGAKEGWAKKDGSYPIKTATDVADAVKDWDRSKGSAADKRHIIKQAKKLGKAGTDKLPPDWPGSTQKDDSTKVAGDGDLKKGADLWSISDLLLLLDGVSRMEDNAELPSFAFGNSVDLPKDLCDRFGAALVELGDIAAEMLDVVLASMKEEEAGEAVANAARVADLRKLALVKAGARHSKADKERIKTAHDALADLDPDCCPAGDGEVNNNGEDDDAEKLAKRLAAVEGANQKLLNETILPVIKDLAARLDKIDSNVKTIAEQPLPMGASSVTLRVIEKTQDGTGGRAPSMETLEQLADRALVEARSGKTAA